MTIDSTLRAKVLQLSKEGHGRNEIARLMTSQGLHISEGTVGNIVRAYRAREHGNSDVQLGVVPNSEVVTSLQMPDASISTGIHMNNTDGFSLLMARHGSNVIPRDGGPLSHLLGDNNTNHTSTDEEEVIPSVTSYSNSPSPVVLVPTSLIPPKPEPFSEPKPRDLFIIKDPETEMQVNIESNANVKYINQDVNSQNAAPKQEEEREFEQSQLQPHQPSLPDPENPSAAVTIDWDSDQRWERRFWARIMEEKKQLRRQRQELNEEMQNLAQVRHNIEQRRRDLQALENKIVEVEPLIPSAKQLKEIGIGFDQALVWIDCIREVSEKEGVDLRTAAGL